MTKITTYLSDAQILIAKAVYYGTDHLDSADEKQLRYFMQVIPHIIARMEKREEGKG